ncbi:TauD/TfdA dioxygenase family protein [Paraburkholderia oxyphila]|uniref:TauD/TfdA dioxygenase family protein n=1 Tax=Paraburkholderia oxyphila TaxID=614212 RepID=UPI000486A93B|nr:TauD/TfdA family dioxygenase [Paraburkholderia oxyphila]
MKIRAMQMGFGAHVEEADLTSLSHDDVNRLRTALLEHGLLVIQNQELSPAGQVRMSEAFGTLETFPPGQGQLAEYPQIFRVASQPAKGHTNVGRYWHSDGSFLAAATPISIWYLVAQPAMGGETLFADLREAYRAYPEERKPAIDGLVTLHRNGTKHPLVMQHPATREPSLYFNVGLTGGVVGYTPEQFMALRTDLDDHLSRAGAAYVHHWDEGDVVIADNFRVAHRATPISADQHRILDRTTVRADGVYWGKNQN